jgi:DNA modification methylase
MLPMNNVYCMDCLDGIRQLENDFFDLAIIDPPYFQTKGDFDFNITFEDWSFLLERLCKEISSKLKSNGNILLWGGRNMCYQEVFFNKYFEMAKKMAWNKVDGVANMASKTSYKIKSPPQILEFLTLYWKKNNRTPIYNNIFSQTSIFNESQESNFTKNYKHPTQKPETLTGKLIHLFSNKNSNILIPFCGSGVECCMSKILGRNFVAFDTNNEYVQISQNRLSENKYNALF